MSSSVSHGFYGQDNSISMVNLGDEKAPSINVPDALR